MQLEVNLPPEVLPTVLGIVTQTTKVFEEFQPEARIKVLVEVVSKRNTAFHLLLPKQTTEKQDQKKMRESTVILT